MPRLRCSVPDAAAHVLGSIALRWTGRRGISHKVHILHASAVAQDRRHAAGDDGPRSALSPVLGRPRGPDDRRHELHAARPLHADRRRVGEMECRGHPSLREGFRSQSLQHAGGNGLDVFSQPALAQSGRAGARSAARRPDEEYRLLRHLRGRAGRQHRRAGARDRILLVDGDGRRAALPLSVVSAVLRGIPDLWMVFARPVLCASAGGVEWRGSRVARLRAPARLAGKRDPRRRIRRAVYFRAPFRALHLRFCHPRLHRHLRRPGADATTVACRMGMENLGACTMPAVLFRVRPPRLLSRHRGHGRPHTDHRHCVGPAPLCRGLAAAVPRSLDMQRSTAAAVHQRSRRVAAHRGAVRGGAGHHHAPRRHPHRRLRL